MAATPDNESLESNSIDIFDGRMISDAAQREFAQLTAGGKRLSNQGLLHILEQREFYRCKY